jgi:DNA-binding IscR family transcriptional regulator
VLHVLLHMADAARPVTSEAMARYLGTNPVVVRRSLAGLRAGGLVTSVKGHGGGWTLARGLDAVSLADVYGAVGRPPLFTMGHRRRDPACAIERAVNDAVDGAFREAEARLLDRFATVRLADLAAALPHRTGATHGSPHHDH